MRNLAWCLLAIVTVWVIPVGEVAADGCQRCYYVVTREWQNDGVYCGDPPNGSTCLDYTATFTWNGCRDPVFGEDSCDDHLSKPLLIYYDAGCDENDDCTWTASVDSTTNDGCNTTTMDPPCF